MCKQPKLRLILGWLYILTPFLFLARVIHADALDSLSVWDVAWYACSIWIGRELMRGNRFAVWVAGWGLWAAELLLLAQSSAISILSMALYSPLHHLGFLALRFLDRLDFYVEHHLTFMLGIYVVHLHLLSPRWLRRGWSTIGRVLRRLHLLPTSGRAGPRKSKAVVIDLATKPKRRPKRRERRQKEPAPAAIRFPKEVEVYEKNAFRMLGLETTAPLRAVSRRHSDALVLLGNQMPLPYEVAPLPSAPPVREQDIRDAYGRLQAARARIDEELFWFHLESQKDRDAYSHFAKGDADAAREVWRPLMASHERGARGRAIHNMAVLEHALAIGKSRKPSSGDASSNGWLGAMRLWGEVCSEDCCWDYFMSRAEKLADPQVTPGFLRHYRRLVPERILGMSMAMIRSAQAAGCRQLATAHAKLIHQSGFPEDVIGTAYEKFFSKHLEELERLRGQLIAAPRDNGLFDLSRHATSRAEAVQALASQMEAGEHVSAGVEGVAKAICDALGQLCGKHWNAVAAKRNEISRDANSKIAQLNNAQQLCPPQAAFINVFRGIVKTHAKSAADSLEQVIRRRAELDGLAKSAAGVMEEVVGILERVSKLSSSPSCKNAFERAQQQARECARQGEEMAAWARQNLSTARRLRNI